MINMTKLSGEIISGRRLKREDELDFFFTGDMLTTSGSNIQSDVDMLSGMGFDITKG